MNTDKDKIKNEFIEYLIEIHKNDLLEILEYEDPSVYFTVQIE